MKKLSLLMLLSVFVFWGCSNDDDEVKNEVTLSFENLLTEENSEFISKAGEPNNQGFQEDTFKDPKNLATFSHYYADWGSGYSFSGFTYMNKTDNTTANSPAPICGKAKIGKVYIAANPTDFTNATLVINQPDQYKIKGTWITNSTWAYMGMTVGDASANKFKKGNWYKAIAIEYDAKDNEVGKTEIMLADYKTDNDLPVKDWIWFDLTPLNNAVKVQFALDCNDKSGDYMNTAQYICLDGITLIEK